MIVSANFTSEENPPEMRSPGQDGKLPKHMGDWWNGRHKRLVGPSGYQTRAALVLDSKNLSLATAYRFESGIPNGR